MSAPLTAVQRHVMALLACDQPDKAIAAATGMSVAAVKSCIMRLRKRHGVATRLGLALLELERTKVQPKMLGRDRKNVVQFSRELDVCCL